MAEDLPALPLIGHADAQARFLSARDRGRLHHGWIVEGPSGIGKARFVQRLAALMLGADTVDAPANDPVMQKVLSGAHPDLRWLKRELNDSGKLRQDITVEQVRDLNKFFSLRPALAGWRVGVIDAIDDANRSGLNAMLKTLEEPPSNAILFLINHGTQTVLPTIRSRCQTLRLYPLSEAETREVLTLQGVEDDGVTALSAGRPGYGLQLKGDAGLAAHQAAVQLLKSIRRPDPVHVSAALVAASRDETALAAFSDALMQWVSHEAEKDAALAATWFRLHEARATSTELALTPLQTATKQLAILQDGLKSLASAG